MNQKPKPQTLTVSLFSDLVQRLRDDAMARRATVSAHVRDVLATYFLAVDQGRLAPPASYWPGADE